MAKPETIFAQPGPEVTNTTPALPVIRPMPVCDEGGVLFMPTDDSLDFGIEESNRESACITGLVRQAGKYIVKDDYTNVL